MLPVKYNFSLFTTAHKENDLCKPIHKCINLFTTTNIYLFTSMKYLLIYYTNIFLIICLVHLFTYLCNLQSKSDNVFMSVWPFVPGQLHF